MMTSLCVIADATLYRWKDSQGNMVMSDRPPPSGTDFEAITTDSSVVRRIDGEAPPEQVTRAPQPASSPQDSQKESNKKKSEAQSSIRKKNPEYCKGARQNLDLLQRPLIRIIDENGEGKILSPKEHEEQRQKALEVVEAHCD